MGAKGAILKPAGGGQTPGGETTMKVLIIEGPPEETDAVEAALNRPEYELVRGLVRETATSLIHKHDAHLIVLVALPFQGWHLQLLRDLRTWQSPPYSLAIAGSDPSDSIALLEAGADACCAYPLEAGVCAAQLLALERRARAGIESAPAPDTVRVRDLTIDFTRFHVTLGGAQLLLTPAEFRILSTLARRAGKVVPASVIFREALNYDASSQQSKDILKVHVRRIRNKIREAGGADDYLCNVRGFGYLLERRAQPPDPFASEEPEEEGAEELSEVT
jgi:DNA-binding response OmpR family regulator